MEQIQKVGGEDGARCSSFFLLCRRCRLLWLCRSCSAEQAERANRTWFVFPQLVNSSIG